MEMVNVMLFSSRLACHCPPPRTQLLLSSVEAKEPSTLLGKVFGAGGPGVPVPTVGTHRTAGMLPAGVSDTESL